MENAKCYAPQILVGTEGLPREQWLEYRRKGIGGSDAAAVLGISPFRTGRDLYYDKLNIVTADDAENWVQLEVGTLLEPLVAKIFAHKTGYKIYRRPFMFQHPLYPWMLADLDYMVELPDGTTAILEIKTTNYNAKDNWWYNSEEIVPIYYESQGRHYMAVMNIDRVYFCCLYGNSEDEAIIRRIDRDMAYEEELIALERDFWENHVLTKTPPPYVEADGDLILESLRRKLGPADKDAPPVLLGQTQFGQLSMLLSLQEQKKALSADVSKLDKDIKRLKGMLIERMGTSCTAVYNGLAESYTIAIFDTVEIDGCAVSRASLHNLSFIENLELVPGCRIKVSKRNQIIPQVEENLDRNCYSRDKVVPARCPCCGQPTRIHMTQNTVNGVEKVTAALFCDNERCETRKLRKFVHFASPKALNIMGLSGSILEKFIGKGWLHSYMDIFALDKYRAEIVQMEGFGEKSWQNLWDAIQHSRITTFEQYLTAMDIPMVGSTASKVICQRFRGNLAEFETAVCQSFDFTQLPDFGETLHRNIHQWFRSEENWSIWTELRRLVCIKTYQPPAASTDMGNPFVGKTLVVTGKVEPYTRDGINTKIESLGAHAGSSVSSKTDYLICGENAGSKLAKAQELGIKILSPDEFFRMAGESV